MAGTEWPFTGLGRQFFEGTLPQLVRNVGKLADELKRYNDASPGPTETVDMAVLTAARQLIDSAVRDDRPIGDVVIPLYRLNDLKAALAKWED